MLKFAIRPAWILAILIAAGSPAAGQVAPESDGEPASEGVETERSGVTLVDAGDEPRDKRRYAPQAGRPWKLILWIGKSVTTERNGMPMPESSLPMVMLTFAASATAADREGRFEIRCTLDDVYVAEQLDRPNHEREKMLPELMMLRGLRITLGTDDRGLVHQVNYAAPQAADATTVLEVQQIAQYLAALIVPMPKEPVGPVARWRATNTIDFGGRTVTRSVEADLPSVEGGQFALKLAVRETADPHAFTLPRGRSGSRGELVQYDSNGTSSLTIDPARPLATLMTGEADVVVEVKIEDSTGTREISSQVSLTLRAEADAPADPIEMRMRQR